MNPGRYYTYEELRFIDKMGWKLKSHKQTIAPTPKTLMTLMRIRIGHAYITKNKYICNEFELLLGKPLMKLLL